MRRFLILLVLAWLPLPAAQQTPAHPAAGRAAGETASSEEQDLSRALGEAGSSALEFIRALEKHLEKYPNSPRRQELERALVKAAIEAKDQRRIILYGEKVLAVNSDDMQLLDRVARALLASDDKDSAARALKYARRYEEIVRSMRSEPPPGGISKGQWQDELDKGAARALVLESRATGNLGKLDEAATLAEQSYQAYPNAEAAREAARWLARSGREGEAIPHLADAFTIPDPRVTDAERARDRVRMGELYTRLNGSEKGLGDLVLEAYDRTTGELQARKLRLRESDPNAEATKITEFTLSAVDGAKLQLSSLEGKTVVFDFWATWCGPCRMQHPLYEQVKQRFKNDPGVVFLSVSADEDRKLVEPFLKENGWDGKVYFEDGLARLLKISSIPTTLIVDRRGQVFSRMNGFLPGRFVEMLSERIREAQKN